MFFTLIMILAIAVFNLIHASSSAEEGAQEISVWFNDFELQDYRPDYIKHTIARHE